ncbi:MAG: hypothetical protein KC441_03145, partial [Anaerolineales bacterium]|nr:hypothetical protein [Anaerolineales bacterium]
MMAVTDLLNQLRSRDIRIWVEDGRLRLNAPKGALTPELQEQLAAHKAEILAYLNGIQVGSSAQEFQLIPRRQADRAQPLSFSQKRLWVLDQMEPGNPIYNIPMASRLIGSLDVSALQESLNTILSRHESLRTRYTAVAGEPCQEIYEVSVLPLPVIDLSSLNKAEREAEAMRLVYEEAEKPFDLARDLLIRTRLLRLAPDEHIFLVTMHHIASDGWS